MIQLDIINTVIGWAQVVGDFRSPDGIPGDDGLGYEIWRLAAKVPLPSDPSAGATAITLRAWFNPGHGHPLSSYLHP